MNTASRLDHPLLLRHHGAHSFAVVQFAEGVSAPFTVAYARRRPFSRFGFKNQVALQARKTGCTVLTRNLEDFAIMNERRRFIF